MRSLVLALLVVSSTVRADSGPPPPPPPSADDDVLERVAADLVDTVRLQTRLFVDALVFAIGLDRLTEPLPLQLRHHDGPWCGGAAPGLLDRTGGAR